MTVYFRNKKSDEFKTFDNITDALNYFEGKDANNDWFLVHALYCDGAGTNGKISKHCVVNEDDCLINVSVHTYPYTNNECEYFGIMCAMLYAEEEDIILSDSKLAVNHINGLYRCKDGKLKPLFHFCVSQKNNKKLLVKWIPRGKNLAGIYLDKVKNYE